MGWEDIKVAVEYDGDQHRSSRAQYVKDIADWKCWRAEGGSWFASSLKTAPLTSFAVYARHGHAERNASAKNDAQIRGGVTLAGKKGVRWAAGG